MLRSLFMQRPNIQVRDAIVAAAAEVFARRGYEGASMAAIARRARTATGNVYRYFPGKRRLAAAVAPAAFVQELERLLKRRVEAYGTPRHPVVSEELMVFSLNNRARVVYVLGQPQFMQRMIGHLVTLALGFGAPESARPVLEEIYGNFVGSIVRIFGSERAEPQVRAVLDQLTAYHLGGLEGLAKGGWK
jgi:AcrR family transcriptional regulator